MTLYIILAVIVLVVIIIFSGDKKEKINHTYNAAFGEASEYLSQYNHGFAITGDKSITRELSCTNVALFGPTGSGKSTSVIFSSAVSLARSKSSLIYFDVSHECAKHCGTYLQSKGYECLAVNFASPDFSESFNCLAYCQSVSDIQRTVSLLITNANGENKGEIFWEQASIQLLSIFARYLVFYADLKYRNFQNVLRLIEKFASDKEQIIDRMILRTKDEDLISAYKATLAMPERTLQSVISSVRASMILFTDPNICRVTSTNSVNLAALREKPVALFLQTPLKDLNYYKPLNALFFQTLFNFVLSQVPDRNSRSIFFLIDEFATMKFPPAMISTVISNIRKYNSGILMCMQDEQSLVAQYGQATSHQLKTNAGCQIFLKGQPLHTCKELSQILGKYSYVDNGITKTRELLTPEEIRQLEDAIILINNKPPLKTAVIPYYDNFWLKHSLRSRDIKFPGNCIENPPLIPFA